MTNKNLIIFIRQSKAKTSYTSTMPIICCAVLTEVIVHTKLFIPNAEQVRLKSIG